MRTVFLFIAVWAAIAGCSAANQPSLNAAKKALETGNYNGAVFEARRLLEDQPENAEANLVLTRAYLMMGNTNAAERTLQLALTADPADVLADQLRADLLIQQGNHKQLANELSNGTLKLSSDLQAQYNGLALQSNGDCTTALERFEAAISENPQLMRARIAKAECEAGARLMGIAITTVREALNVQPDSAHAHLALSNLLEKVRRHTEANNALDEALRHARGQFSTTEYLVALQLRLDRALNKEDLQSAQEAVKQMSDIAADAPVTQLASVQVMVAKGETAKAADTIRTKLKDYQESPQVLALLASALLDSNRLEEGLYYAQRLAAGNPANKRVAGIQSAIKEAINSTEVDTKHWLNLANAQILLGQTLLARKAIQHARSLEQDHRASDFLLVQLDQAVGKTDAPLQTIKSLFELYPDNPVFALKFAELLDQANQPQPAIRLLTEQLNKSTDRNLQQRIRIQLASLYERDGNVSKAIEHLERASPSTPYVLNNLALLYSKNGDTRALATARAAAQQAPNDGEIADTYGWILFRNGNVKDALKSLRASQTSNPTDAERSYHLGAALIAVGQKQEGILMLKNALEISDNFEGAPEAKKLVGNS